ncbi:MAG: hypothetical protein AAGA96_05835 [Verrucomicrobiota bacterium]
MRRVNLGWWLSHLNVFLVVTFLFASTAVLLLRTFVSDWMNTEGPLLILAGLIGILALGAWATSRKRFIDENVAIVRLDDRLELNNQLTSARDGVAPWPEYPTGSDQTKTLVWRWETALLPGMIAALILAVAWLIPVPEVKGRDPLVTSEPDAWLQMEEWAATLKEEELIDPDSLKEVEEKIEELRNQPEEDWFGHSSLEATDTLKESLGRDVQQLAKDLATIERDLEALKSFASELSPAGKEMLLRELEEALKNLEANGLELNESLAAQLSQIDPSQLSGEMMKQLSPEQMKKLQDRLCAACEGLGSMEGLPALGESDKLAWMKGLMAGRGGVDRGPGAAPLFYGDEEDLGTNRVEKVQNDNLDRAAPGDLVAIGETEHDEEQLPTVIQQGGAVASQGQGGDAVWRDSLLPEERALLKRYFK